jgi:hypothetical protein
MKKLISILFMLVLATLIRCQSANKKDNTSVNNKIELSEIAKPIWGKESLDVFYVFTYLHDTLEKFNFDRGKSKWLELLYSLKKLTKYNISLSRGCSFGGCVYYYIDSESNDIHHASNYLYRNDLKILMHKLNFKDSLYFITKYHKSHLENDLARITELEDLICMNLEDFFDENNMWFKDPFENDTNLPDSIWNDCYYRKANELKKRVKNIHNWP